MDSFIAVFLELLKCLTGYLQTTVNGIQVVLPGVFSDLVKLF